MHSVPKERDRLKSKRGFSQLGRKISRTIRKLHRWGSIVVGVFMLAWFISGIVMLLPRTWLTRLEDLIYGTQSEVASQAEPASEPPDLRDIQVSVPQAIASLEKEIGRNVQVARVSVARFGDRLAHQIVLQDGSRHLVDAITGTPISITQAVAEETARAIMPPGVAIANTALLSVRDHYYWGSPPAYKIAFDDQRRMVVYVSAVTGQVEQVSDQFGRVLRWVDGIHLFEPVLLIIQRDEVRKGLLILVSIVGIGVEVTGYYLAWRPRRRSSRTTAVPVASPRSGDGSSGSTVQGDRHSEAE